MNKGAKRAICIGALILGLGIRCFFPPLFVPEDIAEAIGIVGVGAGLVVILLGILVIVSDKIPK